MDIYSFLAEHDIPYERFDHPPVFTCEEAEQLCPNMPGAKLKNLFLRNKNGDQHFLVVVGYEKRVDLATLKEKLGVSKLSFASPERLKEHLGVEPGSVTLLGLINDPEYKVNVIIDEALWGKDVQCHPLVNTTTLAIPHEGVKRFLEATGHSYTILDVPAQTL